MISSRWLSSTCWKVTIPADGRDLLSLQAATFVSARNVSPIKAGFGIPTFSKPGLAASVPSVVSSTDNRS